MEVIPAIDLRGGRCVRLLQGRFDKETVFNEDPVAMALYWEELGAPRLHVVDLDGARLGRPENLSVVAEICEAVKIPLELGGGIRDEVTAQHVLDIGVERVILGTGALDFRLAKLLVEEIGDKFVAGIDARKGKVAVEGWLDTTEISAFELGKKLSGIGVKWIAFTDIARDGMQEGANVSAVKEMVASVPAETKVIAAGGVTTLDDIRRLKDAGAAGVIIGMALYTGQLKLPEALEEAC